VDVLRAANKSYRRHAVPIVVHDILCSLHNASIIAESKVVVSAEVDDLFSVGSDEGRLGRRDNALLLIGTRRFDIIDNSSTHLVQSFQY
jgi:hypothetical protein